MFSEHPFSGQQIVVKWIEFAAAGGLLLAAARLAVHRLRQPADRITLIRMALLTVSLVPLLLAIVDRPAWHLGIVAASRAASTADSSLSLPMRPALQSAPQTTAEGREVTPSTAVVASAAQLEFGSSASIPARTLSGRFDFWVLAALGLVAIHGLAAVGLLAEWIYGLRFLRGMSARSEAQNMPSTSPQRSSGFYAQTIAASTTTMPAPNPARPTKWATLNVSRCVTVCTWHTATSRAS